MTPIEIILNFIIIALLGGAIVYVHQKFKNAASKEDLNDITTIVEEVKQKYKTESEQLKSQLSVLTDRKIQVFTEEKEALVIFYTRINEWIYDTLTVPLLVYDYIKLEELKEKTIKINDIYNTVNVAAGKMRLLVDDDKLILAAHEMILEILKLHVFINLKCEGLKLLLEHDREDYEYIKYWTEDQPYTRTPVEVKISIEKSLKRKDEHLKDYSEKYLELNQNALRKINTFEALTKKYIRA